MKLERLILQFDAMQNASVIAVLCGFALLAAMALLGSDLFRLIFAAVSKSQDATRTARSLGITVSSVAREIAVLAMLAQARLYGVAIRRTPMNLRSSHRRYAA
ncbi:MAG: hypothetical protein JO278_01560 [Dyella sp.]|nr:hypothetical protein [Dyella sp.]